jgi:uncharacterized membrane protein SpoIIM required for sporulation
LIVVGVIVGLPAFLVVTVAGVNAASALAWDIDRRRERGLPVAGRRVAFWCMVLLFAYALIPLAVVNGAMVCFSDLDCM